MLDGIECWMELSVGLNFSVGSNLVMDAGSDRVLDERKWRHLVK